MTKRFIQIALKRHLIYKKVRVINLNFISIPNNRYC